MFVASINKTCHESLALLKRLTVKIRQFQPRGITGECELQLKKNGLAERHCSNMVFGDKTADVKDAMEKLE